jgi:hypothetical protein
MKLFVFGLEEKGKKYLKNNDVFTKEARWPCTDKLE